jgi:fimbrial chaperone protein
MGSRFFTKWGLVSLLLFFAPQIADAGEFRVTPIRLDFDRGARSGVITVANEGEEDLHVQMRAFEWSQDAEGKDQYVETEDIIFFPRMMTVENNDKRILRAGIRIPAAAREKTYRLFIEEIPGPRKREGVNVAIAIRFGVPIFVKPLEETAKGEIESIELSKGQVHVRVRNTGNVHFTISSVDIRGKNSKGEEIFSKELSGWYLLSNVSRTYSAPVPEESCKDISALEIAVKTNRFDMTGNLDVVQEMCRP